MDGAIILQDGCVDERGWSLRVILRYHFHRMDYANPGIAEYEKKTTRVIPVLVLTRLP